jgi:hypothetical protein
MTNWVVTTQAEGQHGRVREVEHDGADEEDDERSVAEEYPDGLHLAALLPVLCTPGEVVVDLCGLDQKQHERRRNRERHDEEKDAPVRDEVAEHPHGDCGCDVASRVEGLVTALTGIEGDTSDDPEGHGTDARREDARRSTDQDLSADDGPEARK